MAGRFASVPTLLLTAWSLVGCYSYIPVAPARPAEPARAVRVTLTPAGTTHFTQSLGNNVRELEGTITRVTADTVELAVERTVTVNRESFVSQGDTVAVPRQLAEVIAVREYSRKRTVVIGAAVLSVLVLALTRISSGGSSASGSPIPGPTQP